MTRIRCQLAECVFWYKGLCNSDEIDLDPEVGCLSHVQDRNPGDDEEWDDEDLFDEDEWEEDF